jgi:hypothetical protein
MAKITRRVVIDIQINCVPIVHIEQLGDERLLSVIPALNADGIHIERG